MLLLKIMMMYAMITAIVGAFRMKHSLYLAAQCSDSPDSFGVQAAFVLIGIEWQKRIFSPRKMQP
jgi:hypothetical protein